MKLVCHFRFPLAFLHFFFLLSEQATDRFVLSNTRYRWSCSHIWRNDNNKIEFFEEKQKIQLKSIDPRISIFEFDIPNRGYLDSINWKSNCNQKIYCSMWRMTLTPRLAIASFNNCTTSSPTTPEQLKPLVHFANKPFVKPSCFNGNENVKPNGNRSLYTLCSYRNHRIKQNKSD